MDILAQLDRQDLIDFMEKFIYKNPESPIAPKCTKLSVWIYRDDEDAEEYFSYDSKDTACKYGMVDILSDQDYLKPAELVYHT